MPEIVVEYLALLRALFVPDEKPRVWPHFWRTLLRHRRRPLPPPIVCLVGAKASESTLLERTSAWLVRGNGRAAPRVLVTADPPTGATSADSALTALVGLLDRLRIGLAMDNSGAGPITFPRYRIAAWLVGREFAADVDVTAELEDCVPELLRVARGRPQGAVHDAADAAADKTPWPVQVLVRLWPALQLWLFVSGRAPGLSREARWFMGQRYLSPELSVSFLGFAGRLVQPNRRHEDPEQVAKLLVHAFLEDLRCAYRHRLLRPSSWRRTAYPVVLLQSVEPGGVAGKFLRTVNDIRNDTGMFDPLAVVATMTHAPDNRPVGEIEELFAEPPGRTGAPRGPLAQWRDTIGALRRRHADGAWYLVLSLPDSLVRSVGALPAGPGSLPPLPPFWTRRRQVVALVAVVVLLVAAVPVARSLLPEQAPCESHPGTVIRAGECVGYSADDRLTFGSDQVLTDMQREVFRQNEIAAQRHAASPRRPLVSLIYFAGLTYSTKTNEQYPRAQVEELAGLAMRQRELNRAPQSSEPLLRVVVANGGANMVAAPWVTDNLLRPLVRADPGVLAVVGMDRSSKDTQQVIGRFGELGVPVVPTTLSGDGLEDASPLYLQPVPSNVQQARLIADYVLGARYPAGSAQAGQRRYDKVVVYYPDAPDDLYVRSLAAALEAELRPRPIGFDKLVWAHQAGLNGMDSLCSNGMADTRTVHVFAGRNYDFVPFLKSAVQGCGSADLPTILGDDAVTRVIADPHGLETIPIGLPVRYVTKGAPVVLGGRPCVEGADRIGTLPAGPAYLEFCALLAELSRDNAGYRPAWPADRTGLAYEVAGMVLDAVGRNAGRSARTGGVETIPNRAAVAMEIREQPYAGMTGTLRFSDGRIAHDATLGILRSDNVRDPGQQQRCVLLHGTAIDLGPGDPQSNRCPDVTRADDETWSPPSP
ncbi:ABC transporter substrate-binding protein [Nocardia sp. N2S4-5]|uniref:ABC transporter substrate-binding protein n=1 Tax=Nocardia sp. N2S4-5 TaxID=3351565 RepID=UPI0037D141E6